MNRARTGEADKPRPTYAAEADKPRPTYAAEADKPRPTYAVVRKFPHSSSSRDINRPASLAGELEKRGIDSHDPLHVRSFLDHNRPYTWLGASARGSRTGESSGAFVYRGALLEADENLVRHLRRWTPYIGRFGLLVLELTLPPATAAGSLDRTPAIAYDATHGYSDQLPGRSLGVPAVCA